MEELNMKILHVSNLGIKKEWFDWTLQQEKHYDLICITGELENEAKDKLDEEVRKMDELLKNFKNKPLTWIRNYNYECAWNQQVSFDDFEQRLEKDKISLFGYKKTIKGIIFGFVPKSETTFSNFSDCDILLCDIPPKKTKTSLDGDGDYDTGDENLYNALSRQVISPKHLLAGNISYESQASKDKMKDTEISSPRNILDHDVPGSNKIEFPTTDNNSANIEYIWKMANLLLSQDSVNKYDFINEFSNIFKKTVDSSADKDTGIVSLELRDEGKFNDLLELEAKLVLKKESQRNVIIDELKKDGEDTSNKKIKEKLSKRKDEENFIKQVREKFEKKLQDEKKWSKSLEQAKNKEINTISKMANRVFQIIEKMYMISSNDKFKFIKIEESGRDKSKLLSFTKVFKLFMNNNKDSFYKDFILRHRYFLEKNASIKAEVLKSIETNIDDLVINLDTYKKLEENKFIKIIENAIFNNKQLVYTTKKVKDKEGEDKGGKDVDVEPIKIFFDNGYWYFAMYVEKWPGKKETIKKNDFIVRLDNIDGLELKKSDNEIDEGVNCTADLAEFRKLKFNAWGHNESSTNHELIIEIENENENIFKYFQSKKFTSKQRTYEEDGKYKVEFNYTNYHEVAPIILSWINYITIERVSDDEFAEHLADRIGKFWKNSHLDSFAKSYKLEYLKSTKDGEK